MSTMHDSRRSPDTRPVLLRRQGRPAPSCGPGTAPRPPVSRFPPSAIASNGERPPRFTARLVTVLEWLASHPQIRCDVNIPAGSRSEFAVSLRLDGNALRLTYLVLASREDDEVVRHLNELVVRLRKSRNRQ